MTNILRIAFGFVFVVAGISLLWPSGIALYEALLSTSWPVTEAMIMTSEVLHTPNNRIPYSPHIIYSYRLGTEQFVGSNIRIMDESMHKLAAIEIVRDYPIGKQVQVHYSPENFNRAVLEPGLTGLIVLSPVISITLTVIGVFLLRFTLVSEEQ